MPAFKGPGQWRSQADEAQAATRPPKAALEPPVPQARRSEDVDLDRVDVDALVAEAESDADEVT